MENLNEMLKGVLKGCVLEIISREETYGYEITRRLNTLGLVDDRYGSSAQVLCTQRRGTLNRDIMKKLGKKDKSK